MPIHTERTIAANRPDIVLKNKKDKTCLLIDMAIPLDTSTSVKTTEKLNKDKDLEIEVEWMWGQNYTTKIPGNINIHELQKITLLSVRVVWGSYGCKDQLLINKAIIEEVKHRHIWHDLTCMRYFECFSITVSTIYCFNPKFKPFFVRNWVLLYTNVREFELSQ